MAVVSAVRRVPGPGRPGPPRRAVRLLTRIALLGGGALTGYFLLGMLDGPALAGDRGAPATGAEPLGSLVGTIAPGLPALLDDHVQLPRKATPETGRPASRPESAGPERTRPESAGSERVHPERARSERTRPESSRSERARPPSGGERGGPASRPQREHPATTRGTPLRTTALEAPPRPSVVTGVLPELTAGVPLVLAVLPDVVAAVPAVAERLPELVGTVPEVVGSVPEVVGAGPDGDHSGAPPPRGLPSQPAEPPSAPAVAPPPAPPSALAQQAAPAPVPAEPPGSSVPLRQSPEPGAGGAAGPSRPSPRGADAWDIDSGFPSTPDSPVDPGAGTQYAGPTPPSAGQAAVLPGTAGSQSSTRTPSIFRYGDATPTGRSPGVPALPG
ncbi:hypothetical protein GCM10022225_53100 [Plantactinospora mayteni]|uniref:Uncharacterized protein n=1 Tax=Plantactinospora mayteni TaxID=566021 RepID=A0ABQ4EJJ7_9ACTN|nr:hypothetical protein Pma05_15010 [Plantactinospora mayteni]